MCEGQLSQVVLLSGKSIALIVCRRHLLLLLLLLVVLVVLIWIRLQLPVLWYTATIATTMITTTAIGGGGLIVPGHVRPHGTDRAEPVAKRNLQFALDAGLGVEALGRILEGTSVNVDGRLGALARLAQR